MLELIKEEVILNNDDAYLSKKVMHLNELLGNFVLSFNFETDIEKTYKGSNASGNKNPVRSDLLRRGENWIRFGFIVECLFPLLFSSDHYLHVA
jgi:hypothetical protein